MVLPVYLLGNNYNIYSESILDRIVIQDVRTPAEDEYGLECWRVKYYESDKKINAIIFKNPLQSEKKCVIISATE